MNQIWLIIPIIVFAGIIRGYSGFGFAIIAIIGMNLFFDPQQSVVIVLALDLLCSIGLWRKAVQQADFQILKSLIIGAAIGIPIGYSVLLLIPADVLKFLICLGILGLAILLFSEIKLLKTDGVRSRIGYGVVSGICTSSASAGGPIVIYYMLSSKLSSHTQRATLILFFIIADLLACAALLMGGMVDTQILKMVFILIIPTLLAVHFGQSLFYRSPPKSLKSFALPVIIVVAVVGLLKSAVVLWS